MGTTAHHCAQTAKAIVVGGSITGLLAARVLADVFAEVVIIDRDHFPHSSTPRRGVPQSVQPHVLLTQGYRILETLFPGLGEALAAAGAVPIDWGKEFHYFLRGRYNATSPIDTELVSVTCTRPLLEATIRRRVADIPNIQWLEDCRICGLVGSSERVCGVIYRARETSENAHITADLVVDASGRSSHAVEWLTAIDAPVPAATVITPHLGYATQRLQIPADWHADWKVLLVSQEAPHNPRLGYLAQVEGGEWIATLGGYGKDYPPLTPKGFLAFARSLASPAFYEAVKEAQPLTQITAHRATANRRYHYEDMAMPRGFMVMGDAFCALCPVYGQGMTVSARSAIALQNWLRRAVHRAEWETTSFQRQLAACVKLPWNLAVGSDVQFPTTEGDTATVSNPMAAFFQRYMERLLKKSQEDGWVHVRFTEVAHMVKPPAAFFSPRMLIKALRG